MQSCELACRSPRRFGATLSFKLRIPSRIPILYVILGVLVAISVVPMYFYSGQVESINRDRLITNERLLLRARSPMIFRNTSRLCK